MSYEELINELKKINNKEQQIEYLFDYLLKNLEYDYLYLELCKLIKCDKDNNVCFSDLYEEDLLEETLLNFSKYVDIPEHVKSYFRNKEYENCPPGQRTNSPIYENDIIKKGVCLHFSKFIKKVCDDLGIDCYVQMGRTPFAHAWNKIQLENQWLNYDVTYAIYSRDKYNDWNEKSNPQDWFAVSDEELTKLHPEREIDNMDLKF